MTRTFGLLFVLVIALAVLVVVIALLMAWRRRTSAGASVTAPMCGACGYHLAPNPMGLTVCPECGGDFLEVGILAPRMKLSRRRSPTVPLGIAWFVVVGVGMFYLHGYFLRAFSRQLSMNTVSQTSSGRGPFRGIDVTAKRDQIVGEQKPEVLRSDVTVTADDGKDFVFTVDGLTKTIVEAPASSGLKGMAWDGVAAKKIVAAVGGEKNEGPDGESWQKLRSMVDGAMQETAGGFGGMGSFNSSSTSFSSSVFTNRSRGYTEMGSSSKSSGGMTNVIVVGPLRGQHWVVLLTCAIGMVLVLVGLGAIVLFTRERRTQ